MSEDDVLEGVRSVAREHLDHEGELVLSTRLAEALELDSIRMLTLVVELENHFDICLEEGDEEGVETVGDLVAVLLLRLA
ncbi:MAG TPA: phosphopantetheine-binding protein [Myxococcota bacterium]|nr:phosphopantetheine-binding protein [Myxococcota bacterium]